MRTPGLKILIAEDDSVTVLTLKEMLQRMGHTLAAAARNGTEAVHLAEQVKPDLIIMDIEMPGIDGIEAARTILAARPIPIVILTAYSEESLIERTSELGISTYLVKPVNEADLRPAIRLALDRFKDRQAWIAEVARTKESLEARRLVDKAKWLLIKRFGISEEEAHRKITLLCRDRNMKMADVANMIITGQELFPTTDE